MCFSITSPDRLELFRVQILGIIPHSNVNLEICKHDFKMN
jgi:hypothetical protein